jgi:hypothetical protein
VKPLNDEGFELWIRELLDRSGSTVKVVLEDLFPGGRLVGGKYNPVNHTITLYRETIRQQCMQLFGTEDHYVIYAAVVFAHELGHSEDRQLSQLSELLDSPLLNMREKETIALKIEKNAWVFAAKLFPEWKQAAFLQEIVYQSLTPYYKAITTHFARSRHTKKQPATA